MNPEQMQLSQELVDAIAVGRLKLRVEILIDGEVVKPGSPTPPEPPINPTWDELGVSHQQNKHGLRMIEGVEQLRSQLLATGAADAAELARYLPHWYGRIELDQNLTDEQRFSLGENNAHWLMGMGIATNIRQGVQLYQKYPPPYTFNGVPTYNWTQGASLAPRELPVIVPDNAIVFCPRDNLTSVSTIPKLALEFANQQYYAASNRRAVGPWANWFVPDGGNPNA